MASRASNASRRPGLRGVYPANRAAALAGVPLTTVYYWARKEIYVPTLSHEKVMLWSWGDLLALRAISWLRSAKPDIAVRPTTMRQVRTLLSALEREFSDRLGDHLANKSVVLRVDSAGRPFIQVEQALVHPQASGVLQAASPELMVDLLAEYTPEQGLRGPHLLTPRPRLRIVPGKLGGEPHVEDTRLDTRTISALSRRGYKVGAILKFYPFLDRRSVHQAVDLEEQLDRNLGRIAA